LGDKFKPSVLVKPGEISELVREGMQDEKGLLTAEEGVFMWRLTLTPSGVVTLPIFGFLALGL
jgi:hypothetical protein